MLSLSTKDKGHSITCHDCHREGVEVLHINLHARWVWVVSTISWPLYPWERALVPILEKAERAPVPVRTSMESRK
jgi:hypothetical protein